MPTIKLLVDGGDMKPGPAVGQQLGPLGINIGQVVSEVNKATSEFKGMKVPVILNVDAKTKEFQVEVSSPPTSELLKKEVNIEKAADDKKKESVANASIEQIIKVSKVKHQNLLSKDFKATVKSVIGTCASMGILIESKPALEINNDIAEGTFGSEILEQKTETSAEKAEKLKAHFDEVSFQQEAEKKAAEEEQKAKEEKEAAEKPAEGATPGAVPEAGAEAKSEEKPAEEAK